MSSAYPPFGGTPARPCQRCGSPLPLDELTCRNCGYQHAPIPGNLPSASPAGWPGSAPQAIPGQIPGQPSGQQWGRTPSSPLPPNFSAPSSPFSQFSNGPRPSEPLRSGTYPATSPQSMGSGPYPGFPANQQQYRPTSFSQPSAHSQPAPRPPFQSGPFMPPTTTGMLQPPGPFPQARPSGALPTAAPAPRKKRLPVAGIAGSVSLIVLIVAGALLGPKVLAHLSNSPTSAQPTQVSVKSLPTPNATPLFADTFTDNKNGWNTQNVSGKFSSTVTAGTLVLEDDSHTLLWEMVPGQHGNKFYSDLQLFVDATLSKGDQNNGYGVFIRGVLNQNGDNFATYYRFSLYGDGSFAIFKGVSDGNGTLSNKTLVDVTANPAIQKAGAVNHLVIIAKGSALSFIVNGQTLSTISDSNYAGGLAALFVSNLPDSQTGAQATFSNLGIFPTK